MASPSFNSSINFPNPKLQPNLISSFNFNTISIPSSKLNSLNYNNISISRNYDSMTCRCNNNNNGDGEVNRRWEMVVWDAVKGAIKVFDDYREGYFKGDEVNGEEEEGEEEEWDWERWKKHFAEVDDQERLVSILKAQLAKAVNMENYKEAAKLKVAIAAAASNDNVGRVIFHLNKSVKEEQYREAALIRDHGGAALVGWWAGLPESNSDPYGCIIQIRAEYGRYVARIYSPRKLATAKDGSPLFEIFLATNKKGEFKKQAVYLKRDKVPTGPPMSSFKSPMTKFDPLSSTGNKSDMFEKVSEDAEDTEDRDNDSNLDNVLRDMIPGVEVKVLNVTSSMKVDQDFISEVVEQDTDDEDEESDFELENVDSENKNHGESDQEQDEIVLKDAVELSGIDEPSQISLKIVVGDLVPRSSSGMQQRELLRVPARIEIKDRKSFTLTIEESKKGSTDNNEQSPPNMKSSIRSVDSLMLDLAKSIGKGRIPMKVLKDVGEMINLSLTQARNRQPLSGSTTFSRIENPSSRDPLNGLYIGAHGLYTSEIIQLRRRYGQWNEDGGSRDPSNIEFYEYVEAVKLTGDPYVPAGEISFRAKVGKRYQLPHKGIIPEEFGVIARYRGQGRLAEPGFQNPRWVDGELVILDGKYVRGGPVVGFVYSAPDPQFLVFFNRLRLQE
ncbi:hypothetical protein Leryth_011852 [Lithospermum erythrorhizon]|nr:hypothetical protein Leryth_011852 [Lithospermum erythrorhizon]